MAKSAIVPAAVAAIAALAGGAWYKKRKTLHGKMTPDREKLFQQALRETKDPLKLKALAKEFRSHGLNAPAEMLEKRAALKELPTEIKDKRNAVVTRTLALKDPKIVKTIAASFEGEGCVGLAQKLREYADSLERGENHRDFPPAKLECDQEPDNRPETESPKP